MFGSYGGNPNNIVRWQNNQYRITLKDQSKVLSEPVSLTVSLTNLLSQNLTVDHLLMLMLQMEASSFWTSITQQCSGHLVIYAKSWRRCQSNRSWMQRPAFNCKTSWLSWRRWWVDCGDGSKEAPPLPRSSWCRRGAALQRKMETIQSRWSVASPQWKPPCKAELQAIDRGWGGCNQLGWIDREAVNIRCSNDVCRCIGFEPGVALQMHLNCVAHCFADIGDRYIRCVHPLGIEQLGKEVAAEVESDWMVP